MKENILLYNDFGTEATLRLKVRYKKLTWHFPDVLYCVWNSKVCFKLKNTNGSGNFMHFMCVLCPLSA
jgi:hypothetical protein